MARPPDVKPAFGPPELQPACSAIVLAKHLGPALFGLRREVAGIAPAAEVEPINAFGHQLRQAAETATRALGQIEARDPKLSHEAEYRAALGELSRFGARAAALAVGQAFVPAPPAEPSYLQMALRTIDFKDPQGHFYAAMGHHQDGRVRLMATARDSLAPFLKFTDAPAGTGGEFWQESVDVARAQAQQNRADLAQRLDSGNATGLEVPAYVVAGSQSVVFVTIVSEALQTLEEMVPQVRASALKELTEAKGSRAALKRMREVAELIDGFVQHIRQVGAETEAELRRVAGVEPHDLSGGSQLDAGAALDRSDSDRSDDEAGYDENDGAQWNVANWRAAHEVLQRCGERLHQGVGAALAQLAEHAQSSSVLDSAAIAWGTNLVAKLSQVDSEAAILIPGAMDDGRRTAFLNYAFREVRELAHPGIDDSFQHLIDMLMASHRG